MRGVGHYPLLFPFPSPAWHRMTLDLAGAYLRYAFIHLTVALGRICTGSGILPGMMLGADEPSDAFFVSSRRWLGSCGPLARLPAHRWWCCLLRRCCNLVLHGVQWPFYSWDLFASGDVDSVRYQTDLVQYHHDGFVVAWVLHLALAISVWSSALSPDLARALTLSYSTTTFAPQLPCALAMSLMSSVTLRPIVLRTELARLSCNH